MSINMEMLPMAATYTTHNTPQRGVNTEKKGRRRVRPLTAAALNMSRRQAQSSTRLSATDLPSTACIAPRDLDKREISSFGGNFLEIPHSISPSSSLLSAVPSAIPTPLQYTHDPYSAVVLLSSPTADEFQSNVTVTPRGHDCDSDSPSVVSNGTISARLSSVPEVCVTSTDDSVDAEAASTAFPTPAPIPTPTPVRLRGRIVTKGTRWGIVQVIPEASEEDVGVEIDGTGIPEEKSSEVEQDKGGKKDIRKCKVVSMQMKAWAAMTPEMVKETMPETFEALEAANKALAQDANENVDVDVGVEQHAMTRLTLGTELIFHVRDALRRKSVPNVGTVITFAPIQCESKKCRGFQCSDWEFEYQSK